MIILFILTLDNLPKTKKWKKSNSIWKTQHMKWNIWTSPPWTKAYLKTLMKISKSNHNPTFISLSNLLFQNFADLTHFCLFEYSRPNTNQFIEWNSSSAWSNSLYLWISSMKKLTLIYSRTTKWSLLLFWTRISLLLIFVSVLSQFWELTVGSVNMMTVGKNKESINRIAETNKAVELAEEPEK